MTVLQGIILGIIQGLTEFLPISSSAHLKIAESLLGIEGNLMAFDVFLHVGTLIPVLLVFWNDIWALIKKPFQKLTFLLITATLPIVIITVLLGDVVDFLFQGGTFIAFAFIITGTLLLFSDKIENGYKNKDEITFIDAIVIGCIQAIAIVPGVSRSGSTITGALFRKLDKKTAASFSFLLSVPAILGALVLQIKDYFTGQMDLSSLAVVPTLAGFFAAMVSGYVAIRFMLNIIRNRKLKYFSYYVYAFAVIILADSLFFNFIF